MHSWALQDAKNRFSEVVDEAISSGPQLVTRRGEPVVVIVPVATWRSMERPRPSFKEFLASAPLEGLDLSREEAERPDADLP
jgi:prevent-host-death family protein